MKAAHVEVGSRFGRWTVVAQRGSIKSVRVYECRCDCGNVRVVAGSSIRSGNSRSCGCLKNEATSDRVKKHGMTRTPTYKCWQNMLNRCRDPNTYAYYRYGGRGISVCDRWHKFESFLADMGERPSAQHSIDRIDNGRDYEPGNCRWATRQQQARNKSNGVTLSLNGQDLPLVEWSTRLGIPANTIRSRIRYGWSTADCLLTPVHSEFRRKS